MLKTTLFFLVCLRNPYRQNFIMNSGHLQAHNFHSSIFGFSEVRKEDNIL